MPHDGGTTVLVDSGVLLGRVARRLADGGPDALVEALDAVVRDLGLRSAVLRDVDRTAAGRPAGAASTTVGTLLAVAGEAVHAVPRSRDLGGLPGARGTVELPVSAAGCTVGTLTVVGARPSQLPVLRAFAAVLGLSLGRPQRADVALALLAAADADADDLADALHDGPVQELVAARYATDAAVRGAEPAPAREAVQAAVQSLRRALFLLRPRGAGDGGLAPALALLSERLQEAGRPALLLDVDPAACAALPAPAAGVCYRLVQAVAGRAGDPATAVRVGLRDGGVRLDVNGAVPLPAPERWAARATALGARLSVPADPTGRVLLTVPVATGPDPALDEPEAIS